MGGTKTNTGAWAKAGLRLALVAAGGLMLAGCADEEGFGDEPATLAEADLPIINGDIDTERDAVVLVFGNGAGCTGTIIERIGASAFVLTAAHCFGGGSIQGIIIADDYNSPSAVALPMVEYQIHPNYNPNSQNLTYDFAMMRVSGADANTPVIPVLKPQEDNLQVGTPLTHVGYGRTSPNGNASSQRRQGSGSISQLGALQIAYQQAQGPCSGDSGGPDLVATPNGERVAGVVSFGDQNCTQFGVSGRPSAIYDGFIAPFIGEGPSSTAATTGASTSATTTGAGVGGGGAGVGGAGAVGGVGAAGPGDGWTNGVDQEDYDGAFVANSGCAAAGGRSGGDFGWLAALALGAVALRRRRGSLAASME